MKLTRQLTNRENKSLDLYFQEIGKYVLLRPEEEIDLAIKIKKGDMAAQDKLVRANLRFVVSVAKMYQNQGLSLGDLINEGNIGLVKAAQRFDETRGFKFYFLCSLVGKAGNNVSNCRPVKSCSSSA
ncbi:MAG: sigma factor [Ignavibacteriaceae bacterium]|nr:sigma factor [Ignavibacteriaceae bacterium]